MASEVPTISVPFEGGEPGLMLALESVVVRYDERAGIADRESVNLDPEAVARCVDWLHAKFGSR